MKQLLKLSAFALIALLAVACNNDDENDGKVIIEPNAVFLDWGETVTVSFSGTNIKSFSLGSYPEKWPEPEINTTARTLTFTAPEQGDEIPSTGSIRVNGITKGGEQIGASLYVSLGALEVDFANEPANCFIANHPNAHYTFDATVRGNGNGQIQPDHVAVIWQTQRNMIQYLSLQAGKASFYIAGTTDDETVIKSGNALIGAFDSEDNLLWSWHIWSDDFDPNEEVVELNGYTLMNRQLGALTNETDTQTDILNAYGLYYQWGRKDPFWGPAFYNASKGTAATVYDGESNSVPMIMIEAATGTDYAYTNAHPTHFITTQGKDESWNGEITNEVKGWNTSSKSVNDPCPDGWRVAPAAAFEGLSIVDDLTAGGDAYAQQYGWTLTDGTEESFFFAAGRRIYADGLIQNIYDESLARNAAIEAQPWVGYNWTLDGKVFAFWLNKANVAQSGLRNDLQMGKANGMSVRCVREK